MHFRTGLSIAGLPFEIVTAQQVSARFIDSYFSAYRSSQSPAFTISIEDDTQASGKRHSGRIVPELMPVSRNIWRIINNNEQRLSIGTIDTGSHWCSIKNGAPSNDYFLSSAIRLCVQFYLERNRGFFLHGACGTIGTSGILFTGKSTSGKSTALCNLHPEKVVAEDAVALRESDNVVTVYAIPFRGEGPAVAICTALCFPKKWKGVPKLTQKNKSTVVAELAANALYCAPSSQECMHTVFSTIVDCSVALTGYNCYFAKSTNLYQVFSDYGLFN